MRRRAVRRGALERLVRALARGLPVDDQVSPADLTFAVLAPADPHNRMARDDDARLDSRFADEDTPDD